MEISKHYKPGCFHPGSQLLNISQHMASPPGSFEMLTLPASLQGEEPEQPVERLTWREARASQPSALSELPANIQHPLESHMTEPSDRDLPAPSHVTPDDTMWNKDRPLPVNPASLQIHAQNCKFTGTC